MIHGINEMYHLKQSNPDKALDATCKEFESMFAHELLKVMGESIPDGLFEDGLASDIYKDMLYQSVGDMIAESGALGVGYVLKHYMNSLGKESEGSSGDGNVADKGPRHTR